MLNDFVFLQIMAPLVATAATGWSVKLIHQRASSDDCPEDTETMTDLSKEQALLVAANITEMIGDEISSIE